MQHGKNIVYFLTYYELSQITVNIANEYVDFSQIIPTIKQQTRVNGPCENVKMPSIDTLFETFLWIREFQFVSVMVFS